jgi:hypothetical protein
MANTKKGSKATTIGDNVVATIEGDVLALAIDMSVEGHPSASGKSQIIATTSGNTAIAGTGLTLGLNLYRREEVAGANQGDGIDLQDLARALKQVQENA